MTQQAQNYFNEEKDRCGNQHGPAQKRATAPATRRLVSVCSPDWNTREHVASI
jgi:hypothetical protein